MKVLTVHDEIFEAERIIKTDTTIVGYAGGVEVFAFRGVNDFSAFQLADGQDWDVDEINELRQQVADLELFISMALRSGD